MIPDTDMVKVNGASLEHRHLMLHKTNLTKEFCTVSNKDFKIPTLDRLYT